jgi:hypothetical protein
MSASSISISEPGFNRCDQVFVSAIQAFSGFPLIIFSLAGIQEARKPIKKGLVIPSPFLFVSK